MKRQYSGDSKDIFNGDYLDSLAASLGHPMLDTVITLTPDDESNAGETNPELFPAREKVIE